MFAISLNLVLGHDRKKLNLWQKKNQIELSVFSNLPTPTGFEMFTLHVVSQSFLYVKEIRLEYVYNLYILLYTMEYLYNLYMLMHIPMVYRYL